MIRLTETYIRDYKLIDESPLAENRKMFWNCLTAYISKRFFGAIEIDGIFKEIGGYFKKVELRSKKPERRAER